MLADVESGKDVLGKKVVVCGSDLSGIEGAGTWRKGHDVTVIDMILDNCADLFFFAHDALFKEVWLSGASSKATVRLRNLMIKMP